MNPTTIQRYGATVLHSARLKTSRAKLDVFADRVRQAAVEPTLLRFGQRLADLMDAATSDMREQAVIDFISLAGGQDAGAALAWIRANHTLYAVLCGSKFADADEAMAGIEIPTQDGPGDDQAHPRRAYDITVRATCLSPMSHGADGKSGNATLFRRMSVLGRRGGLMDLPYYAGNAVRGQVRDLLADHLTTALGLDARRDTPPYALWFFHALYAGGALEEVSGATKALAKRLGDNGAVRSDGIRELRDMLPTVSLLGAALGNRVISGHCEFGDLRPVCREWGNGGDASAATLTEWIYLTRREDHEDHTESHAMIAVTECLKPGTILVGGVDMRLHISDLSRSALGLGLSLLRDRGRLGAQSRADLGMVSIECDNLPDGAVYDAHIREHRDEILAYLTSIGAINARD